jgi:hypothetical protein
VVSLQEEGFSPKYLIAMQIPQLTGSEDERVLKFNQQVRDLVQKDIDYFRENIIANSPAIPATMGSSLKMGHTLIFQQGNLWSLILQFTGYADGGIRDYHFNRTINYDLEHGRILSLEDLFVENAAYLKFISSYCIAELSRKNNGLYAGYQEGADPTLENYRNWNITYEGLRITFDEQQVAPYTEGPQPVLIPYSELSPFIHPQGPLALVER